MHTQVYAGGSAYVTSANIPGHPRTLGLLFEKDNYKSIDYRVVDVPSPPNADTTKSVNDDSEENSLHVAEKNLHADVNDTITAPTSIRSGVPWYDTDGHIIDAHGAGILEHEGKYYWSVGVTAITTDPFIYSAACSHSSLPRVQQQQQMSIHANISESNI